ncbi:hypothetical protein JR316_0006893 [Psilocybe cubensis]|uniref:Uncharacterized protein n=1 Tax=Psilocybe cubensis TaxID=181762 RepID=A0ACB8GX26_PSICU|nr:hypothetical protein JR316_0006893 [Psilocybe cubensis]KAH9480295.1 hypothetical protein JR316_0006893 [Psilocybe cubensis]
MARLNHKRKRTDMDNVFSRAWDWALGDHQWASAFVVLIYMQVLGRTAVLALVINKTRQDKKSVRYPYPYLYLSLQSEALSDDSADYDYYNMNMNMNLHLAHRASASCISRMKFLQIRTGRKGTTVPSSPQLSSAELRTITLLPDDDDDDDGFNVNTSISSTDSR